MRNREKIEKTHAGTVVFGKPTPQTDRASGRNLGEKGES
jgi:hypothetical protein